MKNFTQDFYTFYFKFLSKENFAFTRFSDGEMFIMNNLEVTLDNNLTRVGEVLHGCHYPMHDHKSFIPSDPVHQSFRERLIESYKHKQKNYFVGLSCPCCVGPGWNSWMKELHGEDDNLTWANLFVNANYPLFANLFIPQIQQREIVLVANETFDPKNGELNIKKFFPIGYNAMINNLHLVEDMSEYIEKNNIKDTLFLFSASSLSNILIYELYKKYPNNTYLDIGTTLHKQLGLELARDYLKAYWLEGNTHPDLQKVCVW